MPFNREGVIMNIRYFTLLPVATLAACSDAASQDAALEPGRWEVTMETTKFEVPGANELDLELAQIEAGLDIPNTMEDCLQEADLRGGVQMVVEEILVAEENCPQSEVNAADGKISGSYVCTAPDGEQQITAELDGDYASENFTVTATLRIPDGQYPEGYADAALTLSGKRLEACE